MLGSISAAGERSSRAKDAEVDEAGSPLVWSSFRAERQCRSHSKQNEGGSKKTPTHSTRWMQPRPESPNLQQNYIKEEPKMET